ncbi:ParB N-terminal domain-containing protein [Natronorubrum tibetense]|uniref:ParB N-terminal domain-containing protein n=1 Tax=Natronorubrum tibetense TaxID=63128 RepID=UPI0009D94019|nr:ParB N-terminal domain-containing protein [Natronorubrum tibetense]
MKINHCREIVEHILTHFVSNELAFKVSDLMRSRDIDRYDTPLSPFKRYYIPPSKIKRNTGRKYPPWKNRKSLLGQVQDGIWDQRPPTPDGYPIKFNERSQFICSKLHFEDGVPLTDIDQYKEQIGDFNSELIREDIRRIGELIQSIRNHGYKTQDELGEFPNNKLKRYTNEIAVDIARDGEFLFVDGSHRLTAAKILDLDAVPVVVLVRHEQWMKTIEELIESDRIRELPSNHPDVRFSKLD